MNAQPASLHIDQPSGVTPSIGSGSQRLAITHFDFQHPVFRAPGALFRLNGINKVPTFRVDMDGLEGLIEIDVLRNRFHINAASQDAALIELAIRALRYVQDIRPGDTVPSEIITGQASWSISDKHKKIAEQRLQVQMLSWTTGKEVLLTEPLEVEMFLAQIENREKLRRAFRDAAVALGLGTDNAEAVLLQLELLARELGYIEALRDRYALIPRIRKNVVQLGKSFGNDRSAKSELTRVQALLDVAIQDYTRRFSEVDAQTGEIISALKSLDRQITYIRGARDDLHFLLMDWDPHINGLPSWHGRRTPETDKVYAALYRFLAGRYSSPQSLLKRSALPNAGAEPRSAPGGGRSSTARSLLQRSPH